VNSVHDNGLLAAERKRQFHTLDGLRGIAALAVVLMHFGAYTGPIKLEGAYLAVDLFFLLSGFILAHNYEHRFAAGLRPLPFLRARLTRLFPMYAIGTGVCLFGALGAIHSPMPGIWSWELLERSVLPAALMLPSAGTVTLTVQLFPLNPPAWSLFWEIVINWLYVVSSRRLTDRALILTVAASAAGMVLLAIRHGSLDAGPDWPTFWAGAIRVCFSFPAGVLLYRVWKSDALPKLAVPPIVILISAALVLAVPAHIASRALCDLAATLVVFPLILLSAARAEPRVPKVYVLMGLISYPLYAVHYVALRFVNRLANQLPGALTSGPWFGLSAVVILVGFSWLLARYADKPLRDALSR
jgi:peptidoglycan/LPS O-acetylase OafA/YrhL